MRVVNGQVGDREAVRATCNTTAVTVSSLYLATHSAVVTMIGTAASIFLVGWMLWLSCKYGEVPTVKDQELPAYNPTPRALGAQLNRPRGFWRLRLVKKIEQRYAE